MKSNESLNLVRKTVQNIYEHVREIRDDLDSTNTPNLEIMEVELEALRDSADRAVSGFSRYAFKLRQEGLN